MTLNKIAIFAILYSMRTRPQVKIPDRKICLDIMVRFEMPEHVIRHSLTVSGLAVFLSKKINVNGSDVNVDLVRAAGLLHDITKRYSFNRPLDHALTGAKLVRNLGYKEVGEIVRQHVRISNSRPPGRVSEVELVNYADKRVVNFSITSLRDRFDYIKKKYARTEMALTFIEMGYVFMSQLEAEIFSPLKIQPDDLSDLGPFF